MNGPANGALFPKPPTQFLGALLTPPPPPGNRLRHSVLPLQPAHATGLHKTLPPLDPPGLLPYCSPRRAHRGWGWGGGGGGVRGTPKGVSQNDHHDALIILRHISEGNFLQFFSFRL